MLVCWKCFLYETCNGCCSFEAKRWNV